MNLEVIDRLIEKDPSLESSRSSLEAMKDGACCIHRSWGFGQISGFDQEKEMLLIDFEAMALLIFPIYHLFFNTLGHSNVKLKKHHSGAKNIEISTQHNNHHTTYNSNFGFVTRIMDQLVGTYHKKLK